MRMMHHPILGPSSVGRPVIFTFSGIEVEGREGEPLAAALISSGRWTIRRTEGAGEPRSIYCGMGHCYECRVTLDGVPDVRACLSPVRESMRVEG